MTYPPGAEPQAKEDFVPLPPSTIIEHARGSPGKIAALRGRYLRGEELFCDRDNGGPAIFHTRGARKD